jgi:DNA-binding transcriptional LysR family regulator
MDFRLRVFQCVAHNHSFTKASKELYISQPAISKHIQELELQYKTPLFERKGNRIELTKAGKLLLVHTNKLLSAYQQLSFEMNILTNHYAGRLVLGASTTIAQYLLPPLLSLFIQRFPDINLSLITGNSREIEQALIDGKITLGLVEGNIKQNSLTYTPFLKDELVIITHINSKFAHYDEITFEELCKLPLVLREIGSGTLDVFESYMASNNLKLSKFNILMQLGSTESIKLFLENSDAIGIISIKAITKELAAGQFKIIDVKGLTAERQFSFVRLQGQNGGLGDSFMQFIQLNASR